MTLFFLFLMMLSFYGVSCENSREFRINATENLYTLHLDYTNWHEAKRKCEAEGATLFVPETEEEAKEAQSVVPESERGYGPWIGVTSHQSSGSIIYETIDGRPLSAVFSKRHSGWEEGPQKCLVLTKYTDLNSRECNIKWIFICKFPLTTTDAPTITESSEIETKETTLSDITTENIAVIPDITTEDTAIDTETTLSNITTEDIAVTTGNHHLGLPGKLCGDGDCAPRGLVDAGSKSHVFFGSVVAEELRNSPPKEKLQIMISILEAIKTHWDKKCNDQ